MAMQLANYLREFLMLLIEFAMLQLMLQQHGPQCFTIHA